MLRAAAAAALCSALLLCPDKSSPPHQTGEYATDEEQEMSPVFPNSIEVFELAENQEALSPLELDPEKLAHKFKEVCAHLKLSEACWWTGGVTGGVLSPQSSRSSTQ